MGQNSADTVVDCSGTYHRHLALLGHDISVRGIHFTNGTCQGDAECPSGDGGALLIGGEGVSVSECRISRCFASAHGGAVSVSKTAGEVYFENIVVTECSSVRGGAIWSDSSDVEIVESAFLMNFAEAMGGGIYVFAGHATVTNTNFTSCTAWYWGGAIFNPFGVVSISGGVFRQNLAEFWYGGAIAVSFGATAFIHGNAQFIQNHAEMDGGAVLGAWGAKIHIDEDTVFYDNSAAFDGGAIYVGPLWDGNDANAGCEVTVGGNSQFRKNKSGQKGGGISATLCQVVIDGHAQFEGNTAQDRGGMLYGWRDVDLIVEGNAEVRGNQAQLGGGIAMEGGEWDKGSNLLRTSSLQVRGQASILANSALTGGGIWAFRRMSVHLGGNASVQDNVADINGGGIAVSDRVVVTVDGEARIHGNAAQEGGGLEVVDACELNVSGAAVISLNRALWRGGGVAVLKGGSASVTEHASLLGNQAADEGGAVFALYPGLLHLAPSVRVSGNEAGAGGEVNVQADGVCGDGRLTTREFIPHLRPGLDAWGETVTYCDDANTNDGDGCSSACTVEAGFVCWGGTALRPDECAPDVCGDGRGPKQALSDPEGHFASTCEGYRKHTGVRVDGEYTLYVERNPSMPITIYCHDMAGNPKEYLTLKRPEDNFILWGSVASVIYRFHFFKVRVTLFDNQVFVNQMDYTFTNGLSELSALYMQESDGNQPRWGNVWNLDGREKTARVDVRGLPVSVGDEWRSTAGSSDWKTYEVNGASWSGGLRSMTCHVTLDGEEFCVALNYEASGTADPDACDDGNALDGDGCSASCTVEDGFLCTRNSEQPATEPKPDVCTCACGSCDAGANATSGRCFVLTPQSTQRLPDVLSAAGHGDQIHLSAGRFRRQHCGGTLAVPGVTISGQGKGVTIVDCQQDSELAEPLRFLQVHAHATTLHGFSIEHSTSSSSHGGAISIRPGVMQIHDLLTKPVSIANVRESVPYQLPGPSHALRSLHPLGGSPAARDLAFTIAFWMKVEAGRNAEFGSDYQVLALDTGDTRISIEGAAKFLRCCLDAERKLCHTTTSEVPAGWTLVTLALHSPASNPNATGPTQPSRLDLFFNEAQADLEIASWYTGNRFPFPLPFTAASVIFGGVLNGEALDVQLCEIRIWNRALTDSERSWLLHATSPAARLRGLPPSFNRDHLRPAFDPTLDPAVVFAAATGWESVTVTPEDEVDLKGREEVQLRVEGDTVVGGEVSFALWAKLARASPDAALLELSEIEYYSFPYSNAIQLAVNSEGGVRYRLWQNPFDYPLVFVPLTEATEGRVRKECVWVETNASRGWFVDSERVLPVGVWTHIAVVHSSESARLYWDGVLEASRPIPLPLAVPRQFVSIGRSSERLRPNKPVRVSWHGDLYGPDDLEVYPGTWVHARVYLEQMSLQVYDARWGNSHSAPISPYCAREALTFQGSVAGPRLWPSALSPAQVLLLAAGASGSGSEAALLLPDAVALQGRVRRETLLDDIAISHSKCMRCDGGAVYAGSGAVLRLQGCTLAGNTALGRKGGAVASLRGDGEASVLRLSHTRVEANEALQGGGVYWESGNSSWVRLVSAWPREPSRSLHVVASNFTGNVAELGGALRVPLHQQRDTMFSTLPVPLALMPQPTTTRRCFPSPDGRYLYSGSTDQGGSSGWDERGLVRFDPRTGEHTVMFEHFVGGGTPRASPDGKFSYWVSAANDVDTFYAGGVARFPGQKSAKDGVFQLDMESGRLTLVANTTMKQTKILALSPDGAAIFYNVGPAIYKADLPPPLDHDNGQLFCGSQISGYADGACADAKFTRIADLVVDGSGQWLYVCDFDANVIRRIDVEERRVELLLGSGQFENADGFGKFAGFSGPVALAWWQNKLFVMDQSGTTLRRVDLVRNLVETVPNVHRVDRVLVPSLQSGDVYRKSHFASTVPVENNGPFGFASIPTTDDVVNVLHNTANLYEYSLHVSSDGTIFSQTGPYGIAKEVADVRMIYSESEEDTIESSVFQDNRAAQGGAVSLAGNSLGTAINSSSFLHNTAAFSGGAVHVSGSSCAVTLHACRLHANQAGRLGGGLFSEASYAVQVTESAWEENEASQGGAVAISSHLDSQSLGLEGSTQAEELWMSFEVQAMKAAAVQSNLLLSQSELKGNRARLGAAVAVLGNASKTRVESTNFSSNVASECGSGLLLASRTPLDVSGPVTFSHNRALTSGAAICLQGSSASEVEACHPESHRFPMMLRAVGESDVQLTMSENEADMGGLLFQDCLDSGEGATHLLSSALRALHLSDAGAGSSELTWPADPLSRSRAGLHFTLSRNTAGYGPLAASQAVSWTAGAAAANGLRLLPGTKPRIVLQLLDVVGNTVQSATRALPHTVQLRMCDGEVCSADSEYDVVLSLFPAVDGRILWEHVDGAEVLRPMAADGTLSEKVTVELRVAEGSESAAAYAPISIGVSFEAAGAGQQYVTRRRWKGKALVSVEACEENQYTVDPRNGHCMTCPAGAECDGRDVRGKVAGSRWEKNTQLGLAMLVSCPAGHTLINSTVGTSQGTLSHDNQQCKPCDAAREYVADPNHFPCRPCPLGAVCDGSTVHTRDGLDALGARWEANVEGYMVLVACPPGHRLVSAEQRGYDNQQCLRCPEGHFIMDPTDPSLQCFPCPFSAFCPGGGPPAFTTPRSGSVSLSLGEASQAEARVQLSSLLAQTFALDRALVVLDDVCSSSGGGCVAAAERRSEEVALSYTLHFPRDRPDTPSVQAVAHTLQLILVQDLQMDGVVVPADDVQFGESEAERAQWEYLVSEAGIVSLVNCPVGYILINASTSQPTCTPCPPTYYSLWPLDACLGGSCPPRSCTSCPRGAACSGKSNFQSLVEGAEWEQAEFGVEGLGRTIVFRIRSCPPGHVLIRTEDNPEADECVQCPVGSYSLDPVELELGAAAGDAAVGSGTDAATAVVRWCLTCPLGSQCGGGTSVEPEVGFWRREADMVCDGHACHPDNDRGEDCDPRECFEAANASVAIAGLGAAHAECTARGDDTEQGCRLRAIVVDCVPGVCEEGGHCAEGHHGPACGLCMEGYAKVAYKCQPCSDTDRRTSKLAFAIIITTVLLFLWFFLSWGPLIPFLIRSPPRESASEAASEAPEPDPEGCAATGLLRAKRALGVAARKVVANRAQAAVWIATFQVLASFGALYRIRWDTSTQHFLQYASVANFDVFTLPGFVCLFQGMSLKTRVLFSTLAPVAATAVHVLPLAGVYVASAVGCCGSLRGGALVAQMKLRVRMSLIFAGIVFYSAISVSTLRPFQCHRELGLSMQDYTQQCLTLERGFVFYWSAVFTLLYPICIPLSMLVALVLHRVPALAKRKQQDAYIRGLQEYVGNLPSEESFTRSQSDPRLGGRKLPPVDEFTRCHSDPRSNASRHGASSGLRNMLRVETSHDSATNSGSAHGSSFESADHQRPALLSRAELFQLVLAVQRTTKAHSAGTKSSECEPDLDNMSSAEVRDWLHREGERLHARHEISVVEPSWNDEVEEERAAIEAVGGLFLPYKVKYWYWEQVEMLQKLALTSAIPIFFGTTYLQISLGLFIILLFICLVLVNCPYRGGGLNLLKAALHVVLFCVLYSGSE